MGTPQSGIFAEESTFHYYLEYRVSERASQADVAEAVKHSLQIQPTASSTDDYLVIGFGKSFWSRLVSGDMPEGLSEFETIHGVHNRYAPSTQADIWVWIHGLSYDRNFDRALTVQHCFDSIAKLELDLPAFMRAESRDLTGFVDGTANPRGEAARIAALVPEVKPSAGGSFALTQRWVHDLQAFNELSVPEQEAVIGRTKADSVELEGDAMPTISHVSRTDVKLDGVPQKIYRRSVPYGTVGEHGLYFVAFSCDINRFRILLQRMFGVWEDDLHDRLTEFSAPVTGSYWFVPSQEDVAVALERA